MNIQFLDHESRVLLKKTKVLSANENWKLYMFAGLKITPNAAFVVLKITPRVSKFMLVLWTMTAKPGPQQD